MDKIVNTSPDISAALDILSFRNDGPLLCKRVQDAFSVKVQESFGKFLSMLKQKDYSLYIKLANKLKAGWGDQALPNELFTPEVLHKILFCDHRRNYAFILEFLVEAIDAQLAINDAFDTTMYKSLWTSNGSHFIAYDHIAKDFSMYEAYLLHDKIPCDFLSPHCLKIDHAALNEPAHHIIDTYEFDEIETVCRLTEDCVLPVYEHLPVVASFLEAFTNVILFKKLQTPGKRSFISSTSDFLVGRTLLINPDTVRCEDIVDGLVHENTHSLLNMLEVIEPWQPPVELSEAGGYSIVSPWSGNSLTARNFLQANFVWFALYNFWNKALQLDLYDPSYVTARVEFIRAGFEKSDPGILSKFQPGAVLMNVLSSMKELTQQPAIIAAYEQV